ncbi:hypothetical protein [Stenotrophomonas sp.]|uniref:hypothetical protein n=1 Tax=Stenotrophomonas sp. TaxID=69392 RepID=UPI002FC6D74E
MPNTGLFYLLEVAGDADGEDPYTFARLRLVRADCLLCHTLLNASTAPALVNVAHGGAVLTCTHCGNRQAISGARFSDFARRVQRGLIPPRNLELPAAALGLSDPPPSTDATR